MSAWLVGVRLRTLESLLDVVVGGGLRFRVLDKANLRSRQLHFRMTYTGSVLLQRDEDVDVAGVVELCLLILSFVAGFLELRQLGLACYERVHDVRVVADELRDAVAVLAEVRQSRLVADFAEWSTIKSVVET